MAAQHDPLADDSAGIDREEGARGHQNMAAICQSLEDQHGLGRVADRGKHASYSRSVRMEKLLKL